MELLLAALGVAVAVWMILSARKRNRRADKRSDDGHAHDQEGGSGDKEGTAGHR